MQQPICPTCHEPMSWQQETRFICPSGHVDSLDSMSLMLMESVFEEQPGLYTMFWRSFALSGHDEHSPEWNADLFAQDIGVTEHQVHLLIASDLARAEWAVQHA